MKLMAECEEAYRMLFGGGAPVARRPWRITTQFDIYDGYRRLPACNSISQDNLILALVRLIYR